MILQKNLVQFQSDKKILLKKIQILKSIIKLKTAHFFLNRNLKLLKLSLIHMGSFVLNIDYKAGVQEHIL